MGSPRAKDKKKSEEFKLKGQIEGVRTEGRYCTDKFPCCLFLIMFVIMVGITVFSFQGGDLAQIFTKFDMDGNECGMPDQEKTQVDGALLKQDFTDYPKKMFTNLLDSIGDTKKMHWAVCVKECPTKLGDQSECLRTTNIKTCPRVQYDTQDVMGYCLPTNDFVKKMSTQMYDALIGQMNSQIGGFSKYMTDLQNSWRLIALMAFISLLITVFYLFLLRWITKPLLYTSLFLIFIFGALVSYWCYKNSMGFPKETDNYKYSITGAIVAGVLTILYVLFLCCQWRNIALGASIMGAAGEFVAKNTRIGWLPPISYVVCIPVFLWFIFTNLFLYSMGTPKFKKGDMFATMEPTSKENALFWIYLFGFFWVIAFIIAIQQFAIATVACLWYFHDKDSDAQSDSVSVWTGVKWAFRYHLGSLAYGSLLIAITTMIKAVFEYFVKKYEDIAPKNACMNCVVCCVRGCVWCLDTCVKFISENAYIQVALNGSKFCEGAENVFYMMVRHPGTFTASGIVGWIMTTIGKGVIVGSSTFLTIVMADNKVLSEKVMIPYVPAFIIFLISWVVSSLFLSIFDFASLAILQCFLTNMEMGGTAIAPDSLKDFVEKEEKEYADKQGKKPKVDVQTHAMD